MSLPEYQFIDKTEDYECPICTLVLTAPVQTRCCGAVFCRSCIEQWSVPTGVAGTANIFSIPLGGQRRTTSGSCCPHCRGSPLQYYDDKRTERMIKNLTVTCSNHKLGCKWTGELRNLSGHLNSMNTTGCEHQVIPCPKKCGKNVLRSHLTKHSSEDCIHRKVECKFCQMSGYYKIIVGSHYDECPRVKIPCPNSCTTSNFLRSELREHIKQCPLEIVSCDYANAGCTQHMARKDIEIHRVTGMSQHLNLVNKKLSQLLEHMECKDCIAPIVMKMSNFSQHEKQENKNWSSPCFYTHANGYKFQLRASVKRTFNNTPFLAVSIVLLEGPFDEHLTWPMCARVSVRLLNQVQNSQHHSVTFQLERQRREAAPHSVDQFLACNRLSCQPTGSQVQFLVSDSVYFQVTVELLGSCQPKQWLNASHVLT